jgi:hypothetical protein
MQDEVWGRFGVWLRAEVQLVGGWDPAVLAKLSGPPVQAES